MFDSTARHNTDNDMDLSSIDSANFDAMVAEEAILDWLVNLESDDGGHEMSDSDGMDVESTRLAN